MTSLRPDTAWLLLLLLLPLSPALGGSAHAPEPVHPDRLAWTSPPGIDDAEGAWVVGNEKAQGIYLFRVKLSHGGRIPPHTHPDTRYTTVLNGTLYAGFGPTADDAALVAIPAGATYVAPAGTPHYLAAKDGDVVYQETGVGPTAIVPVEP